MVFKGSWNIIATSPTDISIQPSTLTVMCSPAKPSVAMAPAAWCLRAVLTAQRVPRRHTQAAGSTVDGAHSSTLGGVCVCARCPAECTRVRRLPSAPEPSCSANCSSRGRAAKADVREPPRRSGTKMLAASARRGSRQSRWHSWEWTPGWYSLPACWAALQATPRRGEAILEEKPPSELSDGDPLLWNQEAL